MKLTACYKAWSFSLKDRNSITFKIPLVMKLTAIFLLSFCLQISARTLGQNITLSEKNASLKEVLKDIKSQSGVFFFYDEDLMKKSSSVNISVKNATLTEVLRVVFQKQNLLTYEIIGDKIITIKERIADYTDKNLAPNSAPIDTTITGVVTDDKGAPLSGVTVTVRGARNSSAITNEEGRYSIKVPDSRAALIFTYVGFKEVVQNVGSARVVNIIMNPEINTMNDVVVIGYGTQKKSDLTGSIASIKGAEIIKTPTTRLDDALRGKVAGVLITPTSGAPGANVTIRIRGSNSLNASNEPLVVIDGFIGAGNLNNINTNDIESIEILKDASATAIYGSRGSNGVVLVTTKRGRKGESKFSFDSYTGIQRITRKLDLMSARQYSEFQNDIAAFTGASPPFPNLSDVGEGTNWQDEVFRTGLITNNTLSVSGGNEKTNFYLSGNYMNQEGIYINTGFKRYQTRLNLDHTVNDKLKTGISLALSKVSENGGSSSLRNVLGYDPTLNVRDESGNFVVQTRSSEYTNDNPVAMALQNIANVDNYRIIGNLYSELELIKGLKYRLNAGINTNFRDADYYSPSTLYSQRNLGGTATVQNHLGFNVLVEQTLNYTKAFGDHSTQTLFGYTRQTDRFKQRGSVVRGFASDVFTTNNLDAGTERQGISSNLSESGLESYLFRTNYVFRSKYYLTLTGRADGSSVFAKNNKWSFFPSVALAWRLGEEEFLKNSGVLSDLKFRASYGRIGNQAISPYQSLAPISNAGNHYIFGPNQNLVSGFAATALANENLKWETTTSLDLGVDVSFLKNRVNATLDYYRKTTDDLLVSVTVPQLTGFSRALRNFGKVVNNGLELSLNTINIENKNFRWETNFNISGNRNKVVDIFNPEGFFYTNFGFQGTGGPATSIIQEGQPLGVFYGLVREGIWKDQAEIDKSGLNGYAVFPGGRRYQDLDGDGIIDVTKDRKVIGNSNPLFFGGLGNNFSYKGLDLSFFLQFTYGNDVFNEADYYLGQAFDYNAYAYMVDRWTPSNTNTNIPSIRGSIRSIATVSETSAIKDGSFIRLRNVNLAYNLPVGNINWLRAAKVYISGTNLLLFDRYDGYDPEINRGTDNLRRGYDDSGYPINKNVILGIILDF